VDAQYATKATKSTIINFGEKLGGYEQSRHRPGREYPDAVDGETTSTELGP
jgi:hypothetical protein